MSITRPLPFSNAKSRISRNPKKILSNSKRKPSLHKISSRSRSKPFPKPQLTPKSDLTLSLASKSSWTKIKFQTLSNLSTPTSIHPPDLSQSHTPNQIFSSFKSSLSPYQQKQIFNYPQIFYFGTKAEKINSGKQNNWGYDTLQGQYKVVIRDHLIYRYQILSIIGQGAFGTVCKCLDHKTGHLSAIKILLNKKKFHIQGETEIKILNLLNQTDKEDRSNIVRLITHFSFRNHLCLVFQLLSLNLYDFLVLSNFQGFDLTFIKRLAIQLLVALRHSKINNVIHADLKPENIMMKKQHRSSIKVIDYGSSCMQNQMVHSYIQSRFYRAPEIVLGVPYTPSVDMWSLGCVLVQLYTGHPIFPAESQLNLLAMIIQVIGAPPKSLLFQASRINMFFNQDRTPKLCLRKITPKSNPLSKMIDSNSPQFLNFVQQVLVWDPEERLSPEEALRHPWVFEQVEQHPRPTRQFQRYRKSSHSAVSNQNK